MRKILSAALALTFLSGCSALDAISSGGVSGSYELRSVNGTGVPAVIYQEAGYRVEVLSAYITLEDDGTYSEAGIIRETANGVSTTRSSESYGYYDYYNGEVTFDDNSGRRYYGTVDGFSLVIEDQGLTMRYQRD